MEKRQGRQGRGGRQGRDLILIIPPCPPCPPVPPAPPAPYSLSPSPPLLPSPQTILQRINHLVLLVLCQFWEHGQSYDFMASLLCYW